MIVELIYTSVPKTLDGPPGYGAVARSADFPEALEARIGPLNRYDHALSASGAGSPVVYSHANFRLSGTDWHVLSRVADGGLDYSRRAVFFAHHIAVTEDEFRGETPAALMREPTLFQSRWDGHVGLLPPRPGLPRAHGVTGGDTWKAVAGNSGWAGDWLDRWTGRGGLPNFLIVPTDADVLGLYAEAAALLPRDEATAVTFLTQMVADRSGLQFDWIGLTAGSKLAASILERHPERTLDLSGPRADAPRLVSSWRRSPSGVTSRVGEGLGPVAPVTPKAPGPVSDDFWKEDEPRTPPRRRPKRPDAMNVPGPPPIPPSLPKMVRRVPLLVGAGVACLVSSFAAGAWWFGAAPPSLEAVEERSPLASVVEVKETPSPPVQPRGPAPIENLAPKALADPAPPAREPVPIVVEDEPEVRPTIVLSLNDWLGDTLVEATAGAWTTVLPIEEQDLPRRPVLKYLPCVGSGVTVEPASGEDGGEGIVLRSAARPESKLSFRLHPERGLEARRPETLDEDLVASIPLGVLEVVTGLDRKDPPARIWLTPQLRPLPFQDRGKSEDSTGARERAFFAKLHERRDELQAVIRLDHADLTMSPDSGVGWRIVPSSPDAEAATAGEKSLAARIDIRTSLDSLPLEFRVTSHFHDGDRPIRVEWIAPESDPDAKPNGKTPNKSETGPKPSGGRSQANKVANKSDPNRTLRELDDRVFVQEMFRRYGRIHGGIVARVRVGDRDNDVPILRFGDPDKSAHP